MTFYIVTGEDLDLNFTWDTIILWHHVFVYFLVPVKFLSPCPWWYFTRFHIFLNGIMICVILVVSYQKYSLLAHTPSRIQNFQNKARHCATLPRICLDGRHCFLSARGNAFILRPVPHFIVLWNGFGSLWKSDMMCVVGLSYDIVNCDTYPCCLPGTILPVVLVISYYMYLSERVRV